ncbi:vacuolar protein sorting-associated protein 8 [Penicillium ochrochloron]
MSSMAEGSGGWAREDELDLGQDEHDSQSPGHDAALDHEYPGPSPQKLEPVEAEVEELDTIDNAQDQASEKTLEADGPQLPQTPTLRQAPVNATPGSVDETASTPDDTPSLHSSITSQVSPTPESDNEVPPSPWDVVRWTKLRKITGQAFSEIGKRNFGRPTCLAVSTSIVIGTSKGIILVFDYQQSLKTIIGTGTKAVECGPITSLALSADHSTVAGGHESGDIFTWEISRSARPFLHMPPIPANQVETRTSDGHIAGSAVIHVGFLGTRRTAVVSADTRGMAFSHLATRGTGSLGRTVKTTRILGRYPQIAPEEMRKRKPSSVLAFSPLPLGNVEQPSDSLGLVAMLTPYLLVIVSTTPVARTQHKSPRPKEVPAHSAMTGALAWFPAIRLKGKDSQTSNTKLVYCWSNVLAVLEVTEAETDEPVDRDRPPSLVFRTRSRWKADEAIVAVQWLSRSVLAVLTITQRLLILEDYTMHVTDSIDLANRHIYHTDLFSSQLHNLVEQLDEEDTSMHGVVADAFYMSFRSYKGRLFLLGYTEAQVGSLSNWADRLLALMEAGDFISAIRLATSYYTGSAERLTVGLPDEDALRQPIVQEKLLEMISASLKYAFGRNTEARNDQLETQQLEELAEVSVTACLQMADEEFLWEEVFNWYEEHESAGIFLDVLEPHIVDGTIRSLPPIAVKALINHFIVTHSAGRLEEIICLLDTTTMDIDQVTTLCKQHNLYDAYIYVWNRCLMDYVGPLEDLLRLIPAQTEELLVNGDYAVEMRRHTNAMKMFPYLSFVFTGRIYPIGDEMDEAEALRAKTALYQYLFSGHLSGAGSINEAGSFGQLQAMLKFDASSFMSMLNEAFEDSFLNEPESEEAPTSGVSINRQYLISILLQVMDTPFFAPSDTIYLDMFVARNLPKYPQYILLSGTTLHQVLVRLCQYPEEDMAEDCELSAEYLLSFYHPPDVQSMVPLFKEARFFRILKSTYRSEKQYPQWITTYLDDPHGKEAIFTALHDCLRSGSGLGKKQRRDVIEVVKQQAKEIAAIDVKRAAQAMQDLAPETHSTFLHVLEDDPFNQYQYLQVLVEPQAQAGENRSAPSVENWMIERYVQLLCKYNPSHVADFVDGLRVGDIHLEELLPSIEESGAIDAAVILLARQGQVRAALDRLVAHLSTLESGLVGILHSVGEAPDAASTTEAIDDLLESLNKYAGVGTWLCQGQTKTAKQSRPASNGQRGVPALEQPLAFDETLWLDLIEAVVRIASNVFALMRTHQIRDLETPSPAVSLSEDTGRLTVSFRTLVQQVFTSLLASTVKGGSPSTSERTDLSFLRILRAFLTRAASWSPSLLELRAVLASVFSAYSYEKSLLTLANGMLDRDLFVHVDEVTRLRQHGWRPRGQVCEICRRRIWGPGVGSSQWTSWEERQADEHQRRISRRLEESHDPASERGKGKAAAMPHSVGKGNDALPGPGTAVDGEGHPTEPVVVFSCRHLYHRQCVLDAISGLHRPTGAHGSVSRREHPDWPVAELFCPACT